MASASVFLIFFVLGASSAGNVTLSGGTLPEPITLPVALGDIIINISTGNILIKFTSDGALGQQEVVQMVQMCEPNVVDLPFYDIASREDISVSVKRPATAKSGSGYLGINISLICGCLMPMALDSDDQYGIASLGSSVGDSICWYIYNGGADISPGNTFEFFSNKTRSVCNVTIASCKNVKLTREATTKFTIFTFN